MRYIIRAVKYLVYFAIFFFIIVAIVMLTDKSGASFKDMFKPDSLWEIAIIFAVVSLLYPLLGFKKSKIFLNSDTAKYRHAIDMVLENAGFILASEEGDILKFHYGKSIGRFTRMYEDTVTINLSENPITVEGLRKDTVRIQNALDYAFREIDEPNNNQ